MKADWEIKKLRDTCEKTTNIKWQNYDTEEFHYIDLSSVSRTNLQITNTSIITSENAPSRAKKIVQKNDVIFATTRPTLKRATIIPKTFDKQICSTGYSVLRNNPNVIIPSYIFYFLRSEEFMQRMEKIQRGTSYPAVTDKDVKNTQIPIPPLAEQKQIVALLDQAFAAIDQAKANIEKNIQNAQELFQSKLNTIFSQTGEGWEEVILKEIINIKHGFAFKSEFFKPEGEYVLLTPGNYYEEGGYKDRGQKQKYYVGEIPKSYILNKIDLLVAMTEQAPGLLGSPLLVPEANKFLHNQRLGLIIVKDTCNIKNEFLFYVFNTTSLRKEVYRTGTGLKVRHTSPTKIGEVKVSISYDKKTQDTVINTLQNLEKKYKKLTQFYQKRLTNLEELKKSILQKAFNGELT